MKPVLLNREPIIRTIHAGCAHAQGAEGAGEVPHQSGRFRRTAQARPEHKLHQAHTSTVQVHQHTTQDTGNKGKD